MTACLPPRRGRIASLVLASGTGLAVLATLASLALLSGTASAGGRSEPKLVFLKPATVIIPELCTVPRCMQMHPSTAIANAIPNHGAKYNVTIVGNGGPYGGSTVQVRMITPGDTLACWCTDTPDATPHLFQQVTNSQGQARFVIGGGGCVEYGLPSIPGINDFAGEVFVDGVRLQEFGVVSSDVVDATGRRATDTPRWNPAGACGAGISDAVEHTGPLANNTFDWCTDFNCDNATSVADAVILTPFLAGAASCPGTSGP